MTSAWGQLEQMLTCAICLDKFKNPRLLPCQHSFCGDACMEGLVDYARRQIKCPECRAEHRIPYQGVSSLPSNVTLIRFLELHSRITGEEPEPVPTFMEKCSVCGEKIDGVQRCAHCDKKVCPECKEAHIDILRREVNRLNGQTKRCFGKMQEFKETLEKSEQRLQANHNTVKHQIEESCRRLIDDLQAKQRNLIEEVDKFVEQEQKTIDKLKVALVSELDVLESNSQLADEKICSNKFTWTDLELSEMKEIYAKAMEFIRLFDPDIGDFTRKIRFNLIPEFDSLRRRICDLGELKFGETATSIIANSFQYCNASGQMAFELCSEAAAASTGSSTGGGASLAHSSSNTNLGGSTTGTGSAMLELPSMQNALMRSQSDHRLASQFQQRLKQQQQEGASAKNSSSSGRYTSGQRTGLDYETEALRSRYGVPRTNVGYGATKDYTNDWPRPSDADSNAGDSHFGSSTHFKSAFMRRKEKERQQIASTYTPYLPRDYDDDDLTSEASYGGASNSGRNVHFYEPTSGASDAAHATRGQQSTPNLFDCKELERAPFSGVPKLKESTYLDMRLHQMGAKAIVDKKQAEEEGRRDKDLVESARQAISQQHAKLAQRQMSEDEIEKQKRANKSASPAPATITATAAAQAPNSDSATQLQQLSNTATMTRASNFRPRNFESEESPSRQSPASRTELARHTGNVVIAEQPPSTSRQTTRTVQQQAESPTTTISTTEVELSESSANASSASSTPTWAASSARRNLYGQAVTEKSKRQLLNAAQEAAAGASYSRRRATAAAAATPASSSADGDQQPTGEASSSTTSTASGSSGKPKRALRSSSRSLSKQSSTDVDANATGTIQRRRRPLTRGDSSQQASVDQGANNPAEVATLEQSVQSKNFAGSGGSYSESLQSSHQESLTVGQQASAAAGRSFYTSRAPDRISTTTDEDEETNQEEETKTTSGSAYGRSYGEASRHNDIDRKQINLTSNDSDSNSSGDDDDEEDDDEDDQDGKTEAKVGYGDRNSGNRRSRELMPNAVNELLDRSAQIRRDSQEQRGRGDSPQRGSSSRSYAGSASVSSAGSTTTTTTAPKQSSFYSSGRNTGGGYSTSSSPGCLTSATRQRLAYQRSQSIRDSHPLDDDTTNTTNSNNSLYTTASSGSHTASSVGGGGRKSSMEDDSQGSIAGSMSSSRSRRLSGNSSDRTLVSHDSPVARSSYRRDSSDQSAAPTYTSRFLARSRTSAALSSPNRSQDAASSDTAPSHYSSRIDSQTAQSATTGEPTVSAARAYLSSRDRFLQSTSLISSGAGSGSSASGSGGYTRSGSSAGLKTHSEYLRNKFASERGHSSTSSAGSSTSTSLMRSRSSHNGFALRLTAGSQEDDENQHDDQGDSDSSEQMFGSKSTSSRRSSMITGSLDSQSEGRSSVYGSKKRLLFKLGARGSEPGNFTWPRGVAVGLGAHGRREIVVADSSNHRVQILDSQGRFLNEFGTYGSAPGEFDCLAGVAINRSSRNYVVSDRYNHRVQLFDFSGRFIRAFGELGREPGKFNLPWGVACDSSGTIYVCDKENHRIQVFDTDGTHLCKFGSAGSQVGQLQHPHYIAVGRRKLVVTDTNNHRAQLFDLSGRLINSFGREGSGDGQFKFPRGVAIDDLGHIIVGDSGNNRVQIFNSEGAFVKSIGTWGSADGEFKGIEGVAVDSNYNILVCDRENHRIQVF